MGEIEQEMKMDAFSHDLSPAMAQWPRTGVRTQLVQPILKMSALTTVAFIMSMCTPALCLRPATVAHGSSPQAIPTHTLRCCMGTGLRHDGSAILEGCMWWELTR